MKVCRRQKNTIKKASLRIAGVILLSIMTGYVLGSCAKTPASPTIPSAPSPSPWISAAAPTGVDPEKFVAAVEAYIKELNTENSRLGELLVQARADDIIGYVDVTLTDLTVWSGFTDAEKKEYITNLGKALDTLAIDNAYPGTLKQVGTDTVLYSPDGQELAERNSLGIVFLH